MSAMTPHIRTLHAEAEALLDQAKSLRISGQFVAAYVVLSIGEAKLMAAKALEANEHALEIRITTIPPRSDA